MPRKSKYPKLRVYVKRGRAGQVWTSYAYDMRGTGKPDVPLGNDLDAALRKWDEIHNRAPRIAGTLEEAFARWERDVLPGYASAETRRGYTKNLRTLRPAFGEALWEDVGMPDLVAYLAARTGKTQANRELALLSVIWNAARLWGLTEKPWPAHGMERSKWKNPERAREFEVTDDLFAAVYAEGDRVLRDCMDVSSATGMRLTDARTILLPAGDLLRLKASKTGKKADFDLALSAVLPELIARRRALRADHLMLLSTPGGKPVSANMLRARWDTARQRAAWRAATEADHLAGEDAMRYYRLAQRIADMFLRDMRKMAADRAGSDEDAARLLQHGDVNLTRKHYRSKVTKLAPSR